MSRIHLPRLAVPTRPSNLSFELPEALLARWNPDIRAKDADNSISIYEQIGVDMWTGEGVTAKRIAAALRSIGEGDVAVNINSPGGDVFEGVAIYNLLRDHPGKVTVRVLGAALSAASIIAMAGDRIEIGRAAFMMVHNVWMVAMGNRHDLRAAAEVLEPMDTALADVYAARTGNDREDMAAMMDKETWFGGSEAVDRGFADALLPADQVIEEHDADSGNAALRRIEAALQKSGMPRSERRALLKQFHDKPGAAVDLMPGAGGQVNEIVAGILAA